MDSTELLTLFGLTRQEGTLYLLLLGHGKLNGYEASKLSGISRSNAYGSLAGLVEKGAAYMIEGPSMEYTPVPMEEFCDNYLRKLSAAAKTLEMAAPALKEETDGYVTIYGRRHIINKLKHMIAQTKYRIYAAVPSEIVELMEPELTEALSRGVRIVLISDASDYIGKVEFYQTEKKAGQLRVITDSLHVLTGDLEDEESSCLYSSKKNLVDVFKEALRNEIKLITWSQKGSLQEEKDL